MQMATMAHVEQNIGIKRIFTICVKDTCEKSDVGLGSTEIENKAISDNLSSIMAIM